MKSTKEMPADMRQRMKQYLENHDLTNGIRPERFIKAMSQQTVDK